MTRMLVDIPKAWPRKELPHLIAALNRWAAQQGWVR